MKEFSLMDLCSSVQACFDEVGLPGTDRILLHFSSDFPVKVFCEERKLANLLNLLFTWIRTDRRIERAEMAWSSENPNDAAASLKGTLRLIPEDKETGGFSLRSLTSSSPFLTLLDDLNGKFALSGDSLLTFAVPLASRIPAPSEPLEFEKMKAVVGDAALCLMLIERYIEQTRRNLTDLEAALGVGDGKAVHRIAHGIKGGALNIHALKLQQAALLLEKEAKTGNLSNGAFRLTEIRREFLTVSDYFTIFIREKAT